MNGNRQHSTLWPRFRGRVRDLWTTICGETAQSRIITVFFYLIALVILYIGLHIGYKVVRGQTKNEDAKLALLLYASAAGIVVVREVVRLLPRILKVKWDKVEFELRQEVTKLVERTTELEDEVIVITKNQGRVGLSARKAAEDFGAEGNVDTET